jgi:hypothetical protein
VPRSSADLRANPPALLRVEIGSRADVGSITPISPT